MFQAYGAAGVSKIVEILRREIMTAMTFVGASTLKDLKPEMASLIYGSQVDHCFNPV
jgi:L-lactate dehydrogenase (cytochrome)